MTSAADHVVDGFADELEKLAFPAQLEKLAFLGVGKAKLPAPVPTEGLGKMWHGIKNSPVGKVIGKPLGMLLSSPAMLAFGTIGGFSTMNKKNLGARAAQKGLA